MIDRLRSAWDARSRREQIMLGVMAAVVVLVFGWFAVLAPLNGAVAGSETRLRKAADRFAQLDAAAKAGGLPVTSGQPLNAVVDASAQAAGLTIDRRREEADGRLTVWLTGADPGLMMTWLTSLARAQGIAVSEMTASRTDGGLLEAQITLGRTTP
jgi:general secretion pathway protein M